MALREPDKKNFETLQRAFRNGDACVVETKLTATGEYRAIICAVQPAPEDGSTEMVPIAVLVWDNPYELFKDPIQDMEDSRNANPGTDTPPAGVQDDGTHGDVQDLRDEDPKGIPPAGGG